jgi:hypothetical protein
MRHAADFGRLARRNAARTKIMQFERDFAARVIGRFFKRGENFLFDEIRLRRNRNRITVFSKAR